jgi:glycosyltransferase involved in cell wall biosynthesis
MLPHSLLSAGTDLSELATAPLVSVVTIFHNAARFLDEAIAGVLSQSFGDWELLLVDDGSTDGSDLIARRHVAAHPSRIRCVAHPERANLGTAASRNLGVAHARGRYIAHLDADDMWLPDFLARRVAALQAEPRAAMAFGPVVRWYGWSGRPGDSERDWVARPWDDLGSSLIEPPALLPVMLEGAPQGGVPAGWLLRRDVILEAGGYPTQFRDMYEDQALLCRIGLRHAAVYLQECDYLYRRHDASMVSVLNRVRDRRAMRAQFLGWLNAELREHGAPARVRVSLRRELLRNRYPAAASMAGRLASLPARAVRRARRLLAASRPGTPPGAQPGAQAGAQDGHSARESR